MSTTERTSRHPKRPCKKQQPLRCIITAFVGGALAAKKRAVIGGAYFGLLGLLALAMWTADAELGDVAGKDALVVGAALLGVGPLLQRLSRAGVRAGGKLRLAKMDR